MKKISFRLLLALFLSYQAQASLVESEVIVEDLPSFTLNSLGTNSVFSSDIWQESEEKALFSLIDSIGTAPLTPASKKVLVLLLTQDTTGYKNSQNNTDTFLIKRLQALVRLNAFNEALTLINQVPAQNQSEEIIKIKTYLLLSLGNTEDALKLTEEYSLGTFTDKARINAFLEKEEKNKAVLSYEIYRENNADDDPVFYNLAESVLLELDTPFKEDPVFFVDHAFLLSRLKNSSINYQKLPDSVKKILIDLPATPIETRIELAEQLNLSADELAKIYTLPLLNLPVDKNHLKRAEHYQSILKTNAPADKVSLLKNLIESAKNDKLLLNIAPLLMEVLNTISAQPEHIDLAFDATQIYARYGNLEKANEWYQLLKDSSSDTYQKQRLLLIPALQLLGAGLPAETNSLLTHFCTNPQTRDCADFWQRIPVIFYEEITAPKPIAQTITPFEYIKEENKLKQGENLIKAILDLNNPLINEKKNILSFINISAPHNIAKELKQESMIYQ